MSHSQILCLIILIPFIGAGLILLFGKHPNLRDSFSLLVATVLCGTVYQLVEPLREGSSTEVTLLEVTSGITLGLSVEPLELLLLFLQEILD